MSNVFKSSIFILVGLMITATAMADVWDETVNGGADAGDFPTGTYQNAATSTPVYDEITGTLADTDVDAYCIQINSATWSADVIAGTETDTRLWLFDEFSGFMMGNDDSSPTGASLQSIVSDTVSFPGAGGLVDSPTDPVVGQRVILAVNGFADDAMDSGGAPLSTMSSNFDALVGIDPASTGIFGSWEGVAQGGGTYDILLTGASLCDGPLPVTLQSFSID